MRLRGDTPERLPVVALKLPRCPRCQRAKSIRRIGTPRNDEARRESYAVCEACGQHFLEVWD